MDPSQNQPVLLSNGPPAKYQSPALLVESGNQSAGYLNSTPEVTKSTFRALRQSSQSIPAVRFRKDATHVQIRERRQRVQTNPRHLALDPLFTKAELQSERYIAYREKQRQRAKKPQDEQVWTDQLEEVFQLALRAIPNLGRKKTPCEPHICGVSGTKPRGRNEHITHFIKLHTGENRCRKQISSHIQVLKDFLKHTDRWMALVTKPGTNELGSNSVNVHHSFSSHMPPSFTGPKIPPIPLGECPWEEAQPAIPILDYRSFRSSTAASMSSSTYDSPPTLGPPSSHQDIYGYSEHNNFHPEDLGHPEYQFLASPPPQHHYLWNTEDILDSTDQWRTINPVSMQWAEEPKLQRGVYHEEAEAASRHGQMPGHGDGKPELNGGRREQRREGFNFWAESRRG